MPVPVGIGLKKDSAGHIFRSVSGNSEGGGKVREIKDRFREEEAFQEIKRGLTRGGPIPSQVFLSKVNQGAGDVGIVQNKPLVEVGKAQEGANIFDFSGGRPACDTIKFDRVHGQLTRFDKVFNLISGEFVFLKLQVKI